MINTFLDLKITRQQLSPISLKKYHIVSIFIDLGTSNLSTKLKIQSQFQSHQTYKQSLDLIITHTNRKFKQMTQHLDY